MNLLYRVTGFINYGEFTSVFTARYGTLDVALKVQHGLVSEIDKFMVRSRKEFNILKKLEGVNGIPNPILLLDYLYGTYEELGLNRSGVDKVNVVPKNAFQGKVDNYFGGIILTDLIKVDREIKPAWFEHQGFHQPKEYFDKLETIVRECHARGIALPMDFTLIEANGEPYLVDLLYAEETTDVEKFDRNLNFISSIRSRFELP